jgi:hypothetical protein
MSGNLDTLDSKTKRRLPLLAPLLGAAICILTCGTLPFGMWLADFKGQGESVEVLRLGIAAVVFGGIIGSILGVFLWAVVPPGKKQPK